MEPLFQNYSSMHSWELLKINQIYELHRSGRGVFLGYFVFSLILVVVGVVVLVVRGDGFGVSASYVAFVAAAVFLAIGFFHSSSVKRSGPIFSYNPAEGIIEFDSLKVRDALERLTFSYEVHRGTSNYPNSELNLILDGERRRFLSSRGENVTLEKVVKELEALGFGVVRYRHPDV